VSDETMPAAEATEDEVPNCIDCAFRAKAEAKPRSFLAWLWRLHTKICPGWKKYQRWLVEQESSQEAG